MHHILQRAFSTVARAAMRRNSLGRQAPAMSLVEHLAELRRRLLLSLVALLAGSTAGYVVAPRILGALARPVGWFVFTAPAEALLARLKVALLVGVVVASPVMTAEVWLFVAPGLRREEKRYAARFVPVVALLFAIGVAFAYLVVYPLALRFFLGFARPDLTSAISVGRFLSFFAAFTLPFGIAFQVPLVVYVMVRLGLLSRSALARSRRFVYVLTFIAAAILTPPDVISQVLMAVPMLVLFEATVLLSRRASPRQRYSEGVNHND